MLLSSDSQRRVQETHGGQRSTAIDRATALPTDRIGPATDAPHSRDDLLLLLRPTERGRTPESHCQAETAGAGEFRPKITPRHAATLTFGVTRRFTLRGCSGIGGELPPVPVDDARSQSVPRQSDRPLAPFAVTPTPRPRHARSPAGLHCLTMLSQQVPSRTVLRLSPVPVAFSCPRPRVPRRSDSPWSDCLRGDRISRLTSPNGGSPR
jgi:hypothetical protein